MAIQSKRYTQASESVDTLKDYDLDEAITILQGFPPAKFDETVELSFRLGVDPRQSDQMIRGTVSLPNGSGKKVVVAVFTEDEQAALDAGADFAGLADLIAKVQGGWMDFDVAVSTPAAMKEVRSIARVLGPRGLMPNPKSGTVTDDVAKAINEVKAGRVEYKMDKTANMGVPVGKRSFDSDKIKENIETVIKTVAKARPTGFRGKFILSVSVCSTMSPGISVDTAKYIEL
ncbi:MAG: 50S ribosomal protein L1 [Verrucomicrobia bacterium]|nr:50S ribosomal protein L1 [Verrucomicrobiota bacterium]MDA1064957.1 50S ribosomal protein L1 [Verrucomicrobiota bacterium]